MSKKTKQQLIEEIITLKQEIDILEDKVEKFERYEQYEVYTDELAAMYNSFINSGFDEDHAFMLLIKTLEIAPKV